MTQMLKDCDPQERANRATGKLMQKEEVGAEPFETMISACLKSASYVIICWLLPSCHIII